MAQKRKNIETLERKSREQFSDKQGLLTINRIELLRPWEIVYRRMCFSNKLKHTYQKCSFSYSITAWHIGYFNYK